MSETYHAVVTLDSSPGGWSVSVDFVEKLPFEVEVIGLCGVEEERIAEHYESYGADSDDDKPITANVYPRSAKTGNLDPDGWLWDGDGTADISDESKFAASVFANPHLYDEEIFPDEDLDLIDEEEE